MKNVKIKKTLFIIFISTYYLLLNNTSFAKQPNITPNEYVLDILHIIKDNSIAKDEVDWDFMFKQAQQMSEGASNIEETYPAIEYVLSQLKTNHSFVKDIQGKTIIYPQNIVCREDIPSVSSIPNDIAYIKVDRFKKTSYNEALNYAKSLQNKIALEDSRGVQGWIVDLRLNSGGNMWPMIAGIGPLLGNGIYGFFKSNNGSRSSWGYFNGASFMGDSPIIAIKSPYILKEKKPKIAVLVSNNVGSSGEAVLISFLKRANVKLFGTRSCGISTSNKAFSLRDGSTLYLTTAEMTDRFWNSYTPDTAIDVPIQHNKIIETARNWIMNID